MSGPDRVRAAACAGARGLIDFLGDRIEAAFGSFTLEEPGQEGQDPKRIVQVSPVGAVPGPSSSLFAWINEWEER